MNIEHKSNTSSGTHSFTMAHTHTYKCCWNTCFPPSEFMKFFQTPKRRTLDTNLLNSTLCWFVSGRFTAMVSNTKFIASQWTAFPFDASALCVADSSSSSNISRPFAPSTSASPPPNHQSAYITLYGYSRQQCQCNCTVYLGLLAANDPTEDFLELQLSET